MVRGSQRRKSSPRLNNLRGKNGYKYSGCRIRRCNRKRSTLFNLINSNKKSLSAADVFHKSDWLFSDWNCNSFSLSRSAKIFNKNNSSDDSFSKNRNLWRIHNFFNVRLGKRKFHNKQKPDIFRNLCSSKHIPGNSLRFCRTELHKIKRTKVASFQVYA